MIVCITGATGFLGRVVVQQALQAGHEIRVLSRRTAAELPVVWRNTQAITCYHAPLHDQPALAVALAGADAVIHLAAAMGGDDASHARDTVGGTESLITAMTAAGVRRLVGVSSFSVYGIAQLHDHAILDEDSPLEKSPERCDAYTRGKLAQDACFSAASSSLSVLIARPGIVYGTGNLWVPAIGHPLGGAWLAIGDAPELPLIYVENCAEALVLAAASHACGIINLVDDYRPSAASYRKILNQTAAGGRILLPLPLACIKAIGHMLEVVNRLCFGGRLHLPGLLRSEIIHTRFKPLRYRNDRAKKYLGWQPRVQLEEALSRSTNP